MGKRFETRYFEKKEGGFKNLKILGNSKTKKNFIFSNFHDDECEIDKCSFFKEGVFF